MKAKFILVCIAVILILSGAGRTYGSHIVGTSITYEYVGPNQYMLTMKFYRDCWGIPAPTGSVSICVTSASLAITSSATLPALPGTGTVCQPSPCVVGNGISACVGGSNFGMEEHIFQGIVTLPQPATDWVFSYADCCRNQAITTLNGGGGGYGSYMHTTLDNLNFPINSSPQFTTPPFAQYCLNTLSTFSFSCFDPDGDSLVYALADADDGGNGCPPGAITPVVYVAPYSSVNPVSSSTPLIFDATTGSLTFTPNTIQLAVIAMVIKEYRNGNLIGEVKRDDEISVVNGVMYTNTMTGKVYADNNNNQVFDNGDQPLYAKIIEALPGPIYATTNPLGNYSLFCMFGNFTTFLPQLPAYYVATPPINTASFNMFFQTDTLNDFALSAPYNAQDLRVILTGTNTCVPGGSTALHITYANVGTNPISGSVNLVLDSNYTYSFSSITPGAISGNTLTWNFSNLLTMSSSDIDVYVSLDSGIALSTPLLSYADISPLAGDSNVYDNSDTLHQFAAGSFDPNEKTVSPDGLITTSQIANGINLTYTVFFQNTGNAPAININIIDTLDQNLNIGSFEVISSSHPYWFDLSGPGIVTFHFDNINLIDSNTNELLSHGFIKYRIKPRSTLTYGEKATNEAFIYFDNNAAVQTNLTSTTVGYPTAINNLSPTITDFMIYPNPASHSLNIEMKLMKTDFLNIQMFNAMGGVVKNIENSLQTGNYKKQIDVERFSKGFYFLKIMTHDGVSVAKVLVE